jgi:hypothetical protein
VAKAKEFTFRKRHAEGHDGLRLRRGGCERHDRGEEEHHHAGGEAPKAEWNLAKKE